MFARWLGTASIALLLVGDAEAQGRRDDDGVLVTVQVLDEVGRALPSAWVRVPDTEGRRRVDAETGVWQARYLYAYDGMELPFKRGQVVEFTISAPGYATRLARYRVRGGKNQLTIGLEPLPEGDLEVDTDITWFRRSLSPDQAGLPPEEEEKPPPRKRDEEAPEDGR